MHPSLINSGRLLSQSKQSVVPLQFLELCPVIISKNQKTISPGLDACWHLSAGPPKTADIMLHAMLSARKSPASTRAQQHHSPAGVIHHCKIKAEVEFIRLCLLWPQACKRICKTELAFYVLFCTLVPPL